MGGRVRAAARRGGGAPRGGAATRRVRPPRDPQPRRRRRRGTHPRSDVARIPEGPPRAARAGRQGSGGRGAAPVTGPAGRRRRDAHRAARRAGAPRRGRPGRLPGAVKRLSVLVAALVVVALVGGLAVYLSLSDGAAAYTAGGHRVSQSDVDRELQALADNATLQKLIRQQQFRPLSTFPGSVASGFAAGRPALPIRRAV